MITYRIDIPDTPYELVPTSVVRYGDHIYVAVCHEHHVVAPIAIHETFLDEIAEGTERYDTVPWDAVDERALELVRGDLEYIANYYGYEIRDELCEH